MNVQEQDNCICTMPYPSFVPCTLPTAPVSRSFGLRSSYEIDILDTDQRTNLQLYQVHVADPGADLLGLWVGLACVPRKTQVCIRVHTHTVRYL
jgi:hypothetical protein